MQMVFSNLIAVLHQQPGLSLFFTPSDCHLPKTSNSFLCVLRWGPLAHFLMMGEPISIVTSQFSFLLTGKHVMV